jgi:hypothetical protein
MIASSLLPTALLLAVVVAARILLLPVMVDPEAVVVVALARPPQGTAVFVAVVAVAAMAETAVCLVVAEAAFSCKGVMVVSVAEAGVFPAAATKLAMVAAALSFCIGLKDTDHEIRMD